jgi:putative ABC transport system ATP-binding protein
MVKQCDPTDNQIKITGLTVTYFPGQSNEVKSLKNVDLSIKEGEFVIFFGPSGCGKSTLLYSLAGLEKFSGNISVIGKKINEMSVKEKEKYHRNTIGMVFQAYHLIPTLTVLQNVSLPLIAAGVSSGERKKRAMELLERFGVKSQALKLPNMLSGGQQQRVAICRSVINNPQILLADEPLGNLDSKSADEVIRLFKDININSKKTVIFVTHDPTYLSIANKIIYMKDGEVVRVQENEDTNLVVKGAATQGTAMQGSSANVPRELEILIKSFPSLAGKFGGLLTPFKAKEIISSILTEMASDDIVELEKKVENLLVSRNNVDNSLFEYLDKNREFGGLGLDRRRAVNLASKINSLIAEIKIIIENEKWKNSGENCAVEPSVKLRDHFIDYFSLKIPEADKEKTLAAMDKIIRQRLKNEIIRDEVEKFFDLPLKDGGAGLDRREARRLAYRMELLMLGKY